MSTNFDDKRAGAAAHVPFPVRVGVVGSDGIAGTNQDNHLEGTLAAAEGSASVKDFGGLGGLGGWGGGVAGGGLGGGYGNTAEGKLIAAAFFDAYNKLVAQIQGTGGAASTVPAARPANHAGTGRTPVVGHNKRAGGSAKPAAIATAQPAWLQVARGNSAGSVLSRAFSGDLHESA